MSKFHINPKSGEPGACKANNGGCPFGGDEAHYESTDDARKAFEFSMAGKEFTHEKNVAELKAKQLANPDDYKEGPTGKGLVHSHWLGGYVSSLLPGAAGIDQIKRLATVKGATISFGTKKMFDNSQIWRYFNLNEQNLWQEEASFQRKKDLKVLTTDELIALNYKNPDKEPELKKSIEGFRLGYPTPVGVEKWANPDQPYDEEVETYADTKEGHEARELAFALYDDFMKGRPSDEELELMDKTQTDPYFATNVPGMEKMFYTRLDKRDRDALERLK